MEMTDLKKTIETLQEELRAEREKVRIAEQNTKLSQLEMDSIKMNMNSRIEAAVEKAKSDVAMGMFETYKQGQNDGLTMIERARTIAMCNMRP